VKTVFDERKYTSTPTSGQYTWTAAPRPMSSALFLQMVRAYQMYRDDNKNVEFKFLQVFT
jgi:hypothetical protein